MININIKTTVVGELSENCYILEKGNECIIIDPGNEYDKIKSNIKLKPIAVLITHRHFDHIGALGDLLIEYDVPVYEFKNLKEQEYYINNFIFDVIFIPGHRFDSVAYYFKDEKIMFVGDTIFKGSIGRTDLETGNEREMYHSLNKIKKYPKDVIIYPGHGPKTTLEYELKNNIYMR